MNAILFLFYLCRIFCSENLFYNPHGWTFPEIQFYEKTSSDNLNNKNKVPSIQIDTFFFNSSNSRLRNILVNEYPNRNKNLILNGYMFNNRYSVYRVKAYKRMDTNKIIGYEIECSPLDDDNVTVSNIIKYSLLDRKFSQDLFQAYLSFGEVFSVYIFDLDEDNIYEIMTYDNNCSTYMVEAMINDRPKLIKEISGLLKLNIVKNSRNLSLVKYWRDFLDFPSEKSAQLFYDLLDIIETIPINEITFENDIINHKQWKPLYYEYLSDNNKLNYKDCIKYNYQTLFENHLENHLLKFKTMKFPENDATYWKWVFSNLDTLKKEIYYGNTYAIKIAYKLYPYSKYFDNNDLDDIINDLLIINPQVFLKELKASRGYIRIIDALDGNYGFEYSGRIYQKYFEIQRKIDSLLKIDDKSLQDIRNLCLDFLEYQSECFKNDFALK